MHSVQQVIMFYIYILYQNFVILVYIFYSQRIAAPLGGKHQGNMMCMFKKKTELSIPFHLTCFIKYFFVLFHMSSGTVLWLWRSSKKLDDPFLRGGVGPKVEMFCKAVRRLWYRWIPSKSLRHTYLLFFKKNILWNSDAFKS